MPKNKQNSKEKSTKDGLIHEPIIQDRIAGLRILELATKYKMDRHTIQGILKKNEERIKQERSALLEDRQERINKALEDDVQNLTELITSATKLMKTAVVKLQKKLDDDDMKPALFVEAVDVTIKAFDKIHATVLAQQKEANKSG